MPLKLKQQKTETKSTIEQPAEQTKIEKDIVPVRHHFQIVLGLPELFEIDKVIFEIHKFEPTQNLTRQVVIQRLIQNAIKNLNKEEVNG